MNQKLKGLKSKAMFTFVGGVLVINPVFAQDTQQPEPAPVQQSAAAGSDASTLDTIVVTGLRNSLENSMNIKRDTRGVVDAISAEDIGKFPDTNIAESLQRITGISIDRRNGEGAQVTARGFGPGFNMVTLNGRQIPGADGFSNGDTTTGGVGSGTRSFNFAQLASESISGITVFKTGRANSPSGGIGATIDILTARPLDRPSGLTMNAGLKLGSDQSQTIGSSITPEISSILSYASDDRRWGASLSTSFQQRRGGDVQSTVNAWNIRTWSGDDNAFADDINIVNAPNVGDLYSIPNDIRYAFSDFERNRINSQAALQFAPTDALTLTLDYTYSTNELTESRAEQTQWLNQGGGFSDIEFDTSGAVAVPIYLREITGDKDFGFEQQRNAQKYKLDSIGFNANWQVTDRFNLNFDAHNSNAKSSPNDPITGASATFFSLAGTSATSGTRNCTGAYCGGNWAQEMWFNTGLPIAARTWFPNEAAALANTGGVVNPDFPEGQLGSQVQRIWYTSQESEVKQGRIDGTLDFDNGRFQFGIDSSTVTSKRLNSNDSYAALGDWGVANVGNEPGMVALLNPVSIVGMFNDFNTGGASPGAWYGNASQLALWAQDAYGVPATYTTIVNNDVVEEETNAVYLQYQWDGQFGSMPASLVVGARYERTDVTSTATIPVPQAVEWQDDNDFRIVPSATEQSLSEEASYSYLLPNLDFSIDFTSDLKGRASFSQTIARPGYGSLYAMPRVNAPSGSVLVSESMRASATWQDPGLKPLESDNIDLALEWYFSPASYVSVTFWDKRVDNFLGNTVLQQEHYGLTDPTSGPDAQAVLDFLLSDACRTQVAAAGNNVNACSANNISLFTGLAMYRNADATGGLEAYDGSNAQWQSMGTAYNIVGEADDPAYIFNVSRPINQQKARIHGWELAGQYFFGDSGFGVQANYTLVQGDVSIDDAAAPGVNQFALTGLSDTANAVFMFEKFGWSARLAWNWRDEFLLSTNNNGSSTNPFYVEDYQQWDFSVNYQFTKQWSAGFEAINLTGEDVRWRARTDQQMVRLVDQSPRYMVGIRYTF